MSVPISRLLIIQVSVFALALVAASCSNLSLPPIPEKLKVLGVEQVTETQLPARDESANFFKGTNKNHFRPVIFRKDTFLVSPHSLDTVAEAAGSAIESGSSLYVGGFTLPGLSPEYDRTLASRLALEVRGLLIANGLPADRVQTTGLGSDALSESPDVAAAQRWVIIAMY